MPRRKKVIEYTVKTLIRDYDKFPLKPGEDLKIVELMQNGDITREQMKQALWDADEAAFRKEWRKKNSDFRGRRKTDGDGDEDDVEDEESDEDGDDAAS